MSRQIQQGDRTVTASSHTAHLGELIAQCRSPPPPARDTTNREAALPIIGHPFTIDKSDETFSNHPSKPWRESKSLCHREPGSELRGLAPVSLSSASPVYLCHSPAIHSPPLCPASLFRFKAFFSRSFWGSQSFCSINERPRRICIRI